VQIFSDWPCKLLRGHKKKFKFEDENAGCAPNFQRDALNAIVSSYNE
jgi:hypothetical protein